MSEVRLYNSLKWGFLAVRGGGGENDKFLKEWLDNKIVSYVTYYG